jgi:hypothetical protein
MMMGKDAGGAMRDGLRWYAFTICAMGFSRRELFSPHFSQCLACSEDPSLTAVGVFAKA